MRLVLRACAHGEILGVDVDGEFRGGAADACLRWKSGELQTMLTYAGLSCDADYAGDPFDFFCHAG